MIITGTRLMNPFTIKVQIAFRAEKKCASKFDSQFKFQSFHNKQFCLSRNANLYNNKKIVGQQLIVVRKKLLIIKEREKKIISFSFSLEGITAHDKLKLSKQRNGNWTKQKKRLDNC